MTIRPLTISILATLALPAALLASNGSVIRSPLAGTGLDADASGSILSTLQAKKSLVAVELAHLDPNAEYSLKVGALTEAQFTTDGKGRARLRFATPAAKNRLTLDFDPRGQTVAVLDASAAVVLQAVVSADGEPEAVSVDERANLVTQEGGKGSASARYTAQKNGTRTFEVEVEKSTETVLHLFVDGIAHGDVTLDRREGRARFSTTVRPGRTPLDFDPRQAQIDLFAEGGVLKFTGKLEAKAKGVNFDTRATKGVAIPATASAPQGARASAKLRIEASARRHFSVELEGVAAGAYALQVDGGAQGTITVAASGEGEIEFTNDQHDDSSELPLNFDPTGATLAISQGATVLFTGPFNPAAGNQAPKPVAGTPTEKTEALASTGLDPDATAAAEFSTEANGEMEFDVEIEHVDAGKYQLFVGGTLRGNINAVAVAGGQAGGKLKFRKAGLEDRSAKREAESGGSGGGGADDPVGDDHGSGSGGADQTPRVALTFDPRGQLIEIKTAAGTFFSHVFGDGSAPATGGTGTTVVPGEIEIALISAGVDPDGTAKAEWKRADTGRESFEVEVEDVDAGVYDLLVGQTVRGSITVAATAHGNRGQIEFEDEPRSGHAVLAFDPLGQNVKVQKNGVVFFERTFPVGN